MKKEKIDLGDIVIRERSVYTVVKVIPFDEERFTCRLDEGRIPLSQIDPDHWAFDVSFRSSPEGLVSLDGYVFE